MGLLRIINPKKVQKLNEQTIRKTFIFIQLIKRYKNKKLASWITNQAEIISVEYFFK